MRNPETMLRVYEELANRFVQQNEPRFRDHCLVLAADAALSADKPQEGERLRQRLLQHNPHHLLRPFATMTEAMQAPDVQEYITDLRRQWPPEFVQKLYLSGRDAPVPAESMPSEPTAPSPTERGTKDATVAPAPPKEPKHVAAPAAAVAPPAPPRRAAVAAAVARPAPAVVYDRVPAPAPPINPAAVWMATMLLLLGIASGLALFFIAFVWPLLD
jgi:hypothetical protein